MLLCSVILSLIFIFVSLFRLNRFLHWTYYTWWWKSLWDIWSRYEQGASVKVDKEKVNIVIISVFLPQRLGQKFAGALSSGVEKALQARRQASLIWSIQCHVWSNHAKAVGWKWRCKYWYFIRGNHPLRRHLTGPPSECGGRSAVWPEESGSHFITRLNWVEKGEATAQDPIWSDNLGPEETGWSWGKTPPLHLTTLD